MRILWHSTSPEFHSGYGVVTEEIVRRLVKAGHTIRIGTKHAFSYWHPWQEDNRVEIFEGTNVQIINTMLLEEDFDYIVTLWDIWSLGPQAFPKEKWVAYVPIDTEWISGVLADRVKDSGMQVAMSRHGEREIRTLNLDSEPFYAPLGVGVDTFRVKPEGRASFRGEFGLSDDTFVIGCVGLNYGDDRKGIIPLLRAFRDFNERHPKSVLYVHTHWPGIYPDTIDYLKISGKLGIDKRVIVPNQAFNDIGRIDRDWLADVYNGFDVFCLPTRGEGFGIPIVEAQACGVPVVTTATTTGPELAGPGWLIDATADDLRWCFNGTWRHEVRPSQVLDALEKAYAAWKRGGDSWQTRRQNARTFAESYAWDTIWEQNWLPILGEMERRLKSKDTEA